MLNRRLIRIRAMQNLFAYEISKSANFQLSLDTIAEDFAPDLNSMEKQNRTKLLGSQKLACSLFTDEIKKGIVSEDEQVNSDINKSLKKAKEYLKLNNKKDFDHFSLQAILDAEKVYEVYLTLLNLLIEIGKKYENKSNLSKNKVIKTLAHSDDLKVQSIKKGISFENESAFINKLYNEALKNNKYITEYAESVNHTSEDELAIIKYIIKNILLKHELVAEFFEKKYIFWSEDKDILRTMLFASFKNYENSGNIDIEKLDDTWDESKDFLKILFNKSVTEEEQVMSYLLPLLRNWEFERIILTDKVLLRLAATELIYFPSIPVKVTINEIIEIAKNYSSEKSGQFINGILNSLVKKLNQNGVIKKTGRGMLDNK